MSAVLRSGMDWSCSRRAAEKGTSYGKSYYYQHVSDVPVLHSPKQEIQWQPPTIGCGKCVLKSLLTLIVRRSRIEETTGARETRAGKVRNGTLHRQPQKSEKRF